MTRGTSLSQKLASAVSVLRVLVEVMIKAHVSSAKVEAIGAVTVKSQTVKDAFLGRLRLAQVQQNA